METKQFMKNYKQFVIDAGLTGNSAAKYVSYLNNACRDLNTIHNHMDLIAKTSNADNQAVYAEEIRSAIINAQNDSTCTIKAKDLRDYRSSANMLIAYISGKAWVKKKGAFTPTHKSVIEYTRKDLKDVFLSRVRTQDRFSYSYGVFAARILGRIATRHKIKLFTKMIDTTKFLYAPDRRKFFLLKDIDKLIIDLNGDVYMIKGDKEYPVYTETYHKGKFVGFEIIKASSMRDLSLDHDVPLYDALKTALDSMIEYKKLSNDIVKFKITITGKTTAQISKLYFDSEYQNLSIDEEEIMKEMVAFLNTVKLTIMKTSYNSSKNKNKA